jgi:hypothetical protein
MVGENQKEELLAKMTKLFSSVSPTKIRYFPSLASSHDRRRRAVVDAAAKTKSSRPHYLRRLE